jgi:[acyl-carrier-protein] S-malonyltransferase
LASNRETITIFAAVAKLACLFPGQGAQSVGMGRALLEAWPGAREIFERASAILGYDLAAVCLDGPAERLDSTAVSQPAIFVASIAALEWLRVSSPEVVDGFAAAAGLSLGEYTALVFARVMDFEGGLRVVQQRGLAMQAAADASAGGMVSILGLEAEQIDALVNEARGGDVLVIANYLCPGNTAASGSLAACGRLAASATAAGAMKAIPLKVAGAFHSALMQPAVERLRSALADVPIHRPRVPVVSNVDALPHDDPEEIRSLLVRQVVEPVRWEASMRYLLDQGFDGFYEIGPGTVLKGLLKRINRKAPCESVGV